MIIFATGQRADLGAFKEIELNGRGLVNIDDCYKTNEDGIFAVGDAVTGTASVIQAIAGARKAVSSIDKYLGGDGVIDEVLSSEQPLDPMIGMEEDFAKRNVVIINVFRLIKE